MSNWIRAARVRAGFSLRGAARVLGVSHQAIYRWELGKAFPRVEVWPAIRKHYGLGPSYLEDMATKRLAKHIRFRLVTARLTRKGNHHGQREKREGGPNEA